MVLKNLKYAFGKIVRVGFNAILLAGMLFPGTILQNVKASSWPLSGMESPQNNTVSPLAIDGGGKIAIPIRRTLNEDPGLVTISGNAGVGGVTMAYSGGGSTTADNSGNYTINVPINWTGMVTPSKTGYTFSPASRNYTTPVTSTLTGQNYIATPLEYTLTITSAHGTVTKSPDQPTYHYGDVVHLTHTAYAGYTFDHWSNSISGTPIYPPGAVAISFDDGYLSTYTDVYPYMKSKGIPGTIYVISSWVDYNEVGLSTAQLQELDTNGWSIANHTFDHTQLDTLSEPEQEAELLSCKNFLDGIGLTKASSHVAYPYGVLNTDTLTAMTNTGMLSGRGTDGENFDPQTVNLLDMPSGSADTLADVKQMTDDAIANHQIFFYHGHQMGESGELSLADFKTWIDYLVSNHIPTLTVNDVYARTFTPIDITIAGNTSVTANYTRSYTISGNAGIGGAVLDYDGGTPVVANASGDYSISVPSGWSGTVTPSRVGYSFSPASLSYSNVTSNHTGQNYTATISYTLDVSKSGTGSGTLTSTPDGIDCGATCSANFDFNTTVTLTAAASTGSTFTGWAGAGCSGTGACVVTMDSAKTVTATFTLNKYLLTVTPAGNGSGTVTSSPAGINCGATCSASYDYNTFVRLTAAHATGSTFTGWSGAGCSGTGACNVTMSAARTVTATFTLNKYLLTVTPAGTGTGTATSSPTGIDCGATCSANFDYNTSVTLTATNATGSTFTGWSGGDCSGTGSCEVNMTDAKTVTATFTLNKYLLTVTPAGTGSGMVTSSPAGINCGATCSANYDYNTIVTLSAAPVTGSTFNGWSGSGCSGTNTCVVTLSAARSVTATFTLNKYLLTVTPAGNGSGTVTSSPAGIDCGATCSASFDYNTSVRLTAAHTNGSLFTGWSGGSCTGIGTCDVSMTEAKTVTATFTLNTYLLTVMLAGNGFGTVTISPTGIDCGATCSANFDYNTSVTLTAVAATGSFFTGWSGGGCSGTGTCDVSMEDAMTVTATFTLNKYLLTVTPAGTGSGTVTSSPTGIDCGATCSAEYDYNTIVTLTATPATGSTFAGWSGGDCTGTGTCVLSMTDTKTITANFSPVIYRVYLPLIHR